MSKRDDDSVKRYFVEVADPAKADLQAIYDYIAIECESPDNADDFLDRLEAHMSKLEIFPESHAPCKYEPWSSMGVKILPVGHYIVHFIIDDETLTVTVTRVLYEGRNIAKIASESDGLY